VLAPVTPGNSESVTPYPTLYEVKNTNAPAVYIEVEFHDNADAAKWIIENTKLIGETIATGILQYFGIKCEPTTTNTLYRVQVGAFGSKANAELFLKTVKAAGFKDAYITTK
jgi:N-acetylmuramoyl-L-alanine amidase